MRGSEQIIIEAHISRDCHSRAHDEEGMLPRYGGDRSRLGARSSEVMHYAL